MRTKKTFKDITTIIILLFAILALIAAAGALGRAAGGDGLDIPDLVPDINIPGITPSTCNHKNVDIVYTPYKRLLESKKEVCTDCKKELKEEILPHSWCEVKEGKFYGNGIDPCENCYYIMEDGDLLYCECEVSNMASYEFYDSVTHELATRNICLICGKLEKLD